MLQLNVAKNSLSCEQSYENNPSLSMQLQKGHGPKRDYKKNFHCLMLTFEASRDLFNTPK